MKVSPDVVNNTNNEDYFKPLCKIYYLKTKNKKNPTKILKTKIVNVVPDNTKKSNYLSIST
jgi:hypothetical protein